jgi:hypothetical protein
MSNYQLTMNNEQITMSNEQLSMSNEINLNLKLSRYNTGQKPHSLRPLKLLKQFRHYFHTGNFAGAHAMPHISSTPLKRGALFSIPFPFSLLSVTCYLLAVTCSPAPGSIFLR